MKVGTITKPNKKGQIVIPKDIREKLNIDSNTPLNIISKGKGVYLYPVKEVITEAEEDSSYLDILRETQGQYHSDDWEKTKKQRQEIELEASKKRKQQW